MKSLITLAAATLALGLATCTANAAPCTGPIEAMSSGLQALTPAFENVTPAQIKRSQDQAMAKGRREAIAAWSAKVRRDCAGRSSLWIRASAKSVEACDQAMGGRFSVCVRATPGRSAILFLRRLGFSGTR